jgi:hypothetical protein
MTAKTQHNHMCIKCNYQTDSNSNFHKHLRTAKHNRLDNTYYCEVCQRNHGFTKSEHEKHMNEHTDIMRVASMIQTYQQAYKHLKQMEIYEDMQEALDKIKRHEEYYMKHRPHKGLNIRKQSVQDPIKRANKIASVIAKLENNEKIVRRTNIDEVQRLSLKGMLEDYTNIN